MLLNTLNWMIKFYREEAPVIIRDTDDWSKKIVPVKDELLSFTMKDLLYPESANELTLIPFYRLHDARYIIYWEVATPDEFAEKQADIPAKKEANQND